MASEGLQLVITADTSQAQKGLKQIKDEVKFFGSAINDARDKVETLRAKLLLLNQEGLKSTFGKKLSADLAVARVELKRLEQQAAITGTTTNNALTKGFSGLRTLANILPGVGIAGILGAVSGAIVALASDFLKLNSSATKNSDIIKDAGKEYEKAVVNVSELRNNIQLAKDGFINKDQVVKQYNETIGKTTGLVNNINEAEKALNKNADAYIQFTLLKAAANVALEKSAQELLNKRVQEVKNLEDLKKVTKVSGGTGELGFKVSDVGEEIDNNLIAFQQKGIRAFDKKIIESKNIAADFQREAAQIAKEFGFNFFGDTKSDKPGKIKEIIERDFKRIQIEITPILTRKPTELSKFQTELRKLQADINKPSDLGVSASPIKAFQDAQRKNAALIGTARQGLLDIQSNAVLAASAIADTLTPAFSNMFDAILAGEDPLKAFFKGLIQSVTQLITKLIAAAAFAAALSFLPGGGGAAKFIPNLLKGLGFFAGGGLVSSPTLGMIGEGAGTRNSNPEVIAPLNKLKAILADSGGGNVSVQGRLVAQGSELVAVLANTNRRNQRSF